MPNLGYRRYAAVVSIVWLFAACSLSGLALWLQPLTGDLTRLGGYAENAFGWNGNHPRFEPPLAVPAAIGEIYDVLVVGDSFSLPVEVIPGSPPDPRNHWTDFLVARTGMKVGSFNRDRVPVDAYLSSARFQSDPPKLFVAEYAERTLHGFRLPVDGHCGSPGPANHVTLSIALTPPLPVPHYRDVAYAIDSKRIDAAIDYLRKGIPRWVAGRNRTPVSMHPLSRRGLFTSADDGDLLVYEDDFAKAKLSDAYLAGLSCYFQRMQRRVEANRVTKFILMVAPDRTTAYGEFLPDVSLPNLTDRLARVEGLSILRLDDVIRSAIRDGVKDVYDPSDTHWSPAGMAIAVEALIRFTNRLDDRAVTR